MEFPGMGSSASCSTRCSRCRPESAPMRFVGWRACRTCSAAKTFVDGTRALEDAAGEKVHHAHARYQLAFAAP